MTKDPVCGMDIEETQAVARSDFEGDDYWFCSKRCQEAFDRNPKAYTSRSDMKLRPQT
jgi:YHS domain-containing protein